MPLNQNDWYILNVKWPAGEATVEELAQVYGVDPSDISFMVPPVDPPGMTESIDIVACGQCTVSTQRCANSIMINVPNPMPPGS